MAGILSQFRLRTISGSVRAPTNTTHATSVNASNTGDNSLNPSSTGLRRPREDDDDGAEDDDELLATWDVIPSKGAIKKRKIFIQDVARRLNVSTRSLENFSEVCTIYHTLSYLPFAHIQPHYNSFPLQT